MTAPPKRWVIIPAGGIGSRMGLPYPKQLQPFGDTTVLEHTLSLFAPVPTFVPVPAQFLQDFTGKIGERTTIVPGGDTRFASVRNAFHAIPDCQDEDLVLIHDAVRPFFDPTTLTAAWDQAESRGALIYGNRTVDTMKEVDDQGLICKTLDRSKIFHAQTPQIFKAGLLREAYAKMDAQPQGQAPTDEAALLERFGHAVSIFEASAANRKLTNREDLSLLQQPSLRIGNGYDVHKMDPDRPLFLGGIALPEGPGLLGHSDADVALHALIDAILGAAGKGDIGQWFPDNDPQYAGIRSTELLRRVWTALQDEGYQLENADITIMAQAPKLAPHIPAMVDCIAKHLQCPGSRINIKATTTEGLGFVGRKEGMAAMATALLRREVPA